MRHPSWPRAHRSLPHMPKRAGRSLRHSGSLPEPPRLPCAAAAAGHNRRRPAAAATAAAAGGSLEWGSRRRRRSQSPRLAGGSSSRRGRSQAGVGRAEPSGERGRGRHTLPSHRAHICRAVASGSRAAAQPWTPGGGALQGSAGRESKFESLEPLLAEEGTRCWQRHSVRCSCRCASCRQLRLKQRCRSLAAEPTFPPLSIVHCPPCRCCCRCLWRPTIRAALSQATA